MLHSDDPRHMQINIRLNAAEKQMLDQLQKTSRPRVTLSKMILFYCEEEARRKGIIHDEEDGTWSIAEAVSRQSQAL